jgi:serine protease Do
VASQVLASTVLVHCSNKLGSGFLVRDDLILTNAHVMCPNGDTIRIILSDRRELIGTRGPSDETLDIALIRVPPSGLPPLTLGDAGALAVGDKVTLFGNPLGYDFTMTPALVTKVAFPLFGIAYVQIDGRVQPGNSGGPLVDREGQVVGIVSLKLTKELEGTGLALPINYAYGGAEPMVAAPSAGVNSKGFADMVARAQEAEKTEIAEINSVRPGPFLYAIWADRDRNIMARIVRPSTTVPSPGEVSFNVWQGGSKVYTFKAEVREWKAITPDLSRVDSGVRTYMNRVGEWLDKNNANVTLYSGDVLLPSSFSVVLEHDIQLELVGADPRAPRLYIS